MKLLTALAVLTLLPPTLVQAQSGFLFTEPTKPNKPAPPIVNPPVPTRPAQPVVPPPPRPTQPTPPPADVKPTPQQPQPPLSKPNDPDLEAGVVGDCPTCKTNQNIKDLQSLVNGARIADIVSWKRHRGLVQIPTKGDKGNIGPCGTFHYSPDRGARNELIDNWASPLSACVMMSVFQDWKKRCPSTQAGCRIAWGDISHKTDPGFGGVHSTHTQGHCWDIRPMRRGAFDNQGLEYPESDSKTTGEFVKMLYDKGATLIYYNDPKVKASRMGNHDNHIHVCIHPNVATRKGNVKNKQAIDACNAYKYDPKICGPGW